MPWIEITKDIIVFDPEVQTYCNNPKFMCPNFGHSWACPPEAPYLEEQVFQYNRFFLVYIKKELKENKKATFKQYEFMRDYMEEEIARSIKEIKTEHNEIQILWDGHCRICQKEKKKCTIDEGVPCRYPDDIKYSMEAVGINVTETARKIDLDIEWPPKNHIFRFGLICLK
jgi:predicted metal-binding protein